MDIVDRTIDRRTAVSGLAVIAASASLAGCARYGNSTSNSSAPVGGGNGAVAKTADIPVGGGVIVGTVVVTQPTAGQFKAFSSTCTHAGCTVASVSHGTITCPCHGSQFSASDGSVLGGPAPTPLPARQITVSGGEISLA